MSEYHPYDWAVTGPPLGIWRTALGSASLLMADTLTIAADGTGTLDLRSAFRGNESVGLVWRHLSPGVMQIVPMYDGLQPAAITEDLWEPVNYVAAWQQTDSADREPILKNQHRDNFWTLTGAMQLVARS